MPAHYRMFVHFQLVLLWRHWRQQIMTFVQFHWINCPPSTVLCWGFFPFCEQQCFFVFFSFSQAWWRYSKSWRDQIKIWLDKWDLHSAEKHYIKLEDWRGKQESNNCVCLWVCVRCVSVGVLSACIGHTSPPVMDDEAGAGRKRWRDRRKER